jgi:hypothetical protein
MILDIVSFGTISWILGDSGTWLYSITVSSNSSILRGVIENLSLLRVRNLPRVKETSRIALSRDPGDHKR